MSLQHYVLLFYFQNVTYNIIASGNSGVITLPSCCEYFIEVRKLYLLRFVAEVVLSNIL